MHTDRFETLAETLIAAGEEEFRGSLAAPDAAEELGRRLELKTILFGVGATWGVLWQSNEGRGIGEKSP